MQTVKYIGFADSEGVEIETHPGVWVQCLHGETLQVSDQMAEGLLGQPSNWERVAVKAKADAITADVKPADTKKDGS